MTIFNDEIYIGNRKFDKDSTPYIVAEIGSNHNKSLQQTKDLVSAVKETGADAVKFQFFKAGELVNQESEAHSQLADLELKEEFLFEMKGFCKGLEIDIFISTFSTDSFEKSSVFDFKLNKVASSEILNFPLLNRIASAKVPVLVSVGMSNWSEVDLAVEIFEALNKKDVVLMHCHSNYPLKNEDVNLRAMKELSNRYGGLIGLSDHTENEMTGAVAVGMGANVLEKHVTLDRNASGPDHFYALEPKNFGAYVKNSRLAFEMLGGHRRRYVGDEMLGRRRYTLIAGRDIKQGEFLDKDNLIMKESRFGLTNLVGMQLFGSRTKIAISAGMAISLDQITN